MSEEHRDQPNVEVFGTRTCRFTAALQDDLDWECRRYTMYYVDEDAAALERLSRLVDAPYVVPVLVEDGIVKQVGVDGRGCYVHSTQRNDP